MGYGSRLASAPFISIRNAYASVNVTTGAYVQLVSSLGADVISAEIVDTSGKDLKIAIGPAGGEVDIYFLPANHTGIVPFHLSKGTALSIKAVSADATTGVLTINLFG